MKILTLPLILLIKIYQNLISPLTPATCRFQPTCSQYSIEALKEHGIFNGSKLMIIRIFSWQPWGKSGKKTLKKKKKKTNKTCNTCMH